ncbi:DUF4240 domain-containing protein [Rhodovulum sp. DZ06]|uniref:DUF4240 domain-containing protein n=1 Tax=Rhodovulum sp. DZ06 TaxID=3425126 RepID=UPI003D33469B
MIPDAARGFTPRFDDPEQDSERLISHVVALSDRGALEAVPGASLYHAHYAAAHDWMMAQYWDRCLHARLERYYTRGPEDAGATLYDAERDAMARFEALGQPERVRRMRRAHCAVLRTDVRAHADFVRKGFRPDPRTGAPEAEQHEGFEKTAARLAALRAECLPQLREGRAECARLGADARELAQWDRWIAEMETGAPAPRADKPDPAKMDEDLFWTLIGDPAVPAAERLADLPDRLAAYRPGEIRRFGMMALEKLEAAYRADIWALAWLLRGGCSDDAFDGFRAGLILAGRAAHAQALADPDGFDPRIPVQGDLAALLAAPAEAHEMRAGKPMRPLRAMKMKLAGPAWEEGDLPTLLPRIAAATEAP